LKNPSRIPSLTALLDLEGKLQSIASENELMDCNPMSGGQRQSGGE
jgi:hypothetical protein